MTCDSISNSSLFTISTDTYYTEKKKSSPLTTLYDENSQQLETNKEFLLFPTYAKRNPSDNSQWIVRAKGWALSHNSSAAKQKMMMGITKSVAGKSSADRNSSLVFEERFKYFLATNKRHENFLIKAIGTTSLEESRRYKRKPMTTKDQKKISLDMFSTRFNHLLSTTTSPLSYYYCHIEKKQIIKSFQQQYKKNYFPITPPTDEDEDDEWKSPTILLSRPSNPISSLLDAEDEDQIVVQDCGVHLKTKGSGFLSGHFLIPHDNILNWAQEQNQCDARLIRIQSVCTSDHNKYSPNQNVVSLIEPTGISIISDIDDTIKDTQIKQGARTVLSKTFFESPKCVTGMADAYMAWYSQGASFHYVSNSPFQLMPMLDRFIRDSQFPPGSMHLRDDGKLISRLVETPGQAKRDAILDILRDFPRRHFVLIGDSGEIDLEIYTRIAVEFPDQILKIYIRDVTTPTIKELKQSTSDTIRKRQRSSPLSSLLYPKRRSQSASDFTVPSLSSSETVTVAEKEKKKKFRSRLGMRRAVTTMFAEYAVEPHLTGHRATTIEEESTSSEDGLLDPHRFQHKISTGEACAQLYQRIERAKIQVDSHIEIILFQDAEVLQNDTYIRNTLWDMWDDLSNSEITQESSYSNLDEVSHTISFLSPSPRNY